MTTGRRTLLLMLASAMLLAACGRPKFMAERPDDMVIGRADAPVTLVEYASVTCAHCAEFQAAVFPALKAKYIDTGKVRYVFREYLTPPNNVAAAGFLLARCAGTDRYFDVVEAVMQAQPEMFAGGTSKNALPVLRRIGQNFGVTDKQFDRCITDADGMKRIQAGMAQTDLQTPIEGTPAFFVNGQFLQRTTGDIQDFDRALSPLLSQTGKP
ncbi:thioredoxin domain-containing protein [Asticcacaulis solisilvae]|uniref:thioredoxin domain-containing protein n=1 Tax=Asticcacaulis solisilvae TaxID=1217274 RepID=UPI003FD7DD46